MLPTCTNFPIISDGLKNGNISASDASIYNEMGFIANDFAQGSFMSSAKVDLGTHIKLL